MRPARVFSSSWGQLESGGTNIGDLAVFEAQRDQLAGRCELGVMSSDPRSTRAAGCIPFGTATGRVSALVRGVLWSDAVLVGGGELAQDVSSLLYTPFNLLPLVLARLFGRPSYGWLIGVGQEGELRPWTPPALRRWLSGCRGVSVRDAASGRTLLGLGLRRDRVLRAADSAFCLCDGWEPGPRDSMLLGAAPRDVSNRTGRLLPLEVRRKLRMASPSGDGGARRWAELLDSHLERHGGRVLLLPFHTGPLSNSDDAMCRRVAGLMTSGDRADILDSHDLKSFIGAMSRCRVVVTAPLHGAILSVVAGAVPVSVPYSSKCTRFMMEAGLGALAGDDPGGALEDAWTGTAGIWEELAPRRSELRRMALLNTRFFEGLFPGLLAPADRAGPYSGTAGGGAHRAQRH